MEHAQNSPENRINARQQYLSDLEELSTYNPVEPHEMRELQNNHKVRRYSGAHVERRVLDRIRQRAYVAHSHGAGCIYVAFAD